MDRRGRNSSQPVHALREVPAPRSTLRPVQREWSTGTSPSAGFRPWRSRSSRFAPTGTSSVMRSFPPTWQTGRCLPRPSRSWTNKVDPYRDKPGNVGQYERLSAISGVKWRTNRLGGAMSPARSRTWQFATVEYPDSATHRDTFPRQEPSNHPATARRNLPTILRHFTYQFSEPPSHLDHPLPPAPPIHELR